MGTFGESLEDDSMENTQNELVVGSLHAEVDAVLQRLSPREAGILRMRYGLDDGQPKTLEDIGYAFNVSPPGQYHFRTSLCSKISSYATSWMVMQVILSARLDA